MDSYREGQVVSTSSGSQGRKAAKAAKIPGVGVCLANLATFGRVWGAGPYDRHGHPSAPRTNALGARHGRYVWGE